MSRGSKILLEGSLAILVPVAVVLLLAYIPIQFGVLLWFFTGIAGFVFWWTTEHDFGLGECFIAAVMGMVGPLSWLIGWWIHGHVRIPRIVLVKKRKRRTALTRP